MASRAAIDERPYVSTGHLPNPAMVQSLVEDAHRRLKSNADGKNSQVYPALARVPSELFGVVCVLATDGHVYGAGDTRQIPSAKAAGECGRSTCCASGFDRLEIKESDMTTYDNGSAMRLTGLPTPPLWVCILLGIVMIIAGLLVLGDVVLFTVISTIFIGWMAIIAGGFEIIHAFWTKGWGGFVWQLLLGALYLAFGIVLVTQPLTSALILTFVLGLLLLISGIVRVLIGISHWQRFGWIMLVSGLFGALAGLIILTGFPATGAWVLGLLLGIDLLTHGVGWLTLAWLPAARTG
jgi:uncharacterized membrane protein HdeD (DUF308 family)